MAPPTAQAQTLRIFSEAETIQRWQSRWVGQTVTIESAQWEWLPFDAGGIVDGDVSSEGSLSVTVPATGETVPLLRQAMGAGLLAEIRQYEFDPQLGLITPPVNMVLVASYLGEVVGLDGERTSIEMTLGSALAPVGVQFPPRSMTSQLIGVPAQL